MDVDSVKHIARLARITVSDSEAEEFSREFSEVLELFEKIDDVECEGEMILPVEPKPSLREDNPSGERKSGGFIKGPRTV